MNTASRVLLWLAIPLVFSVSCVSVRLANPEVKKADGVRYSAPGGDFASFSPDHLDAAWKNPKNGNSISYLSDCDPKNDPSLNSIQKGILQGIQKQEVLLEYKRFNGRQALFTEVKGEVDGIPSQIKLVILRKNKCIYVLTYVGLDSHFGTNQKEFDSFVRGFQAP